MTGREDSVMKTGRHRWRGESRKSMQT